MRLLKGERYTVSPRMDGYPILDSAVPFDRAEAEREHVVEEAETESPGVNRGLPRFTHHGSRGGFGKSGPFCEEFIRRIARDLGAFDGANRLTTESTMRKVV